MGMIFLLLLFTLFQCLRCTPLDRTNATSSGPTSTPLLDRSSVRFSTREESDIIITCLATILACTWTTMHPNIPSPVDSGWDILKRRIRWVFYALIAPELITTFACSQRLAALSIAKQYNEQIVEPSLPNDEREARKAAREKDQSATNWQSFRCTCTAVVGWVPMHIRGFFTRKPLPQERQGRVEEWTTTHGFFVQMGGFMLSKDGQPLSTISSPSKIIKLIKEGRGSISAITTTEEDIQDRSKGDAISKGVVILQTTWFLVQCIARWSTGLVVTELEVVTLGFVVLNGLTYAFWWDKPQNVAVPVYLEWLGDDAKKPKAPAHLFKLSIFSVSFKYFLEDIKKNKVANGIKLILFGIPYAIVAELVSPLIQIIADETIGEDPKLRVSMFFAGNFDQKYKRFVSLSMVLVSVIFAIVHLAPAWFLRFPSHRYMVLWRSCAIITTAIPPMVVPIAEYYYRLEDSVQNGIDIIGILATILYFSSRITIFFIALVALRNIPPGALITIDWISTFPHI